MSELKARIVRQQSALEDRQLSLLPSTLRNPMSAFSKLLREISTIV
jgi:hypothetical protein